MNSCDFQILHSIDPIELAPGVTMSFQVIPPVAVQGRALAEKKPLSFLMGSRGNFESEEPRHRVIIPAPFYLGTFPVTQRQFAVWTAREDYAAWFAATPGAVDESRAEPHRFYGDPNLPAVSMSWFEARAFVQWLNESGLLPDRLEARLPCEAEWEYACRAGTETEFWTGDGGSALSEVGWFYGNSEMGTHVVGEKNAPNPWGLHDLHGNVKEVCEDDFDYDAYANRTDAWIAQAVKLEEGGPFPVEVVHRGGSYYSNPTLCRSASRDSGPRGARNFQSGFRILLGLPGPSWLVEPGSGESTGAVRAVGRDDRTGDQSAGDGPRSVDLDMLYKPRHDSA